jgi:glutamate racemase
VIGVFDSGVGGLCAYRELRRLLPRQDIIYLADRKNAPYGTKSKDELIALTKNDIKRLREMGAKKILIACCTASTVYPYLDEGEREISLPIITPAALVASKYGRVMVIATNHTVASHAFGNAIRSVSGTQVKEFACQELVSLIEGGCRDGRLNEECRGRIEKIREDALEFGAEALVLGCTHFSHLEGEFKKLLPHAKIISPASEGARAMAEKIKEKTENGRTVYT